MKRLHYSIFLLPIILLFSSCVKDRFDVRDKFSGDIKWNPHVALPLAYADLTLGDLVPEKVDTIQHISESALGYGNKDNDKVIQLRYAIDSSQSIDMMRMPRMENYDTTLFLQPISLGNAPLFGTQNSLKTILQDYYTQTDYDDYVDYENLGNTATITERAASTSYQYSSINMPFITIDYALLSSGSMTVNLTNTFAVPVQTDLIVYTDSAGIRQEINTFEFSQNSTKWIQPGETVTETFDFDDTYLGKRIFHEYANLKLGAATGVEVNLQDNLQVTIELQDLWAKSGRALVPPQIVTMDSLVYVTIRDKDATKKLEYIIVDRGLIDYKITSSIDVATEFLAIFESMTHNGDTVTKYAALNKNNPVQQAAWDLANHEIDLTADPTQPYNSIPIRFGYKVYTGLQFMEFGPHQNIKIEISNPDSIMFRYLEGNMGKLVEDVFVDTVDFDIQDMLKNFLSGEITFHDPKLRIVYKNPIGLPGKFELTMNGITKNGQSVSALKEDNKIFTVQAPDCMGVRNGESITSYIEFNNTNSNISDFIRLLPNKITMAGRYYLNIDEPDENNIKNCISSKEDARISVEVEMPMNLSIKNLVLQQDVPMENLGLIDNINNIESLRLFVFTENQFPLDATIKIIMLDTTLAPAQQELGVLDIIALKSGNAVNGKVARNAYTKHTEEIFLASTTDNRLEKFVNSNKLRLQLHIETDKQGDEPVIFYTYYGLKFNLAVDGKFLYEGRLE